MKCKSMSIVICAFVLIATTALDIVLKLNIERVARQQAHYNLEQTKACVNELILGEPKLFRQVADEEIETALFICGSKQRITQTGDMFAFNLRTLKFLFDPSIDCHVDGGKYMTKESECSLHQDKQACYDSAVYLTSGTSSELDTYVSWKFDNAREMLEWKVLPSDDYGFDGVKRSGTIKPHQVVLVQGIQEDELTQKYMITRVVIFIGGLLIIILSLAFILHKED